MVSATYPMVGSFDGPRITVNDYLKDPLRIPALVLDIMQDEFIIETVLRDAGGNSSGAVRYDKSTPLFADNDSTIRAEFTEVPGAQGSVGQPGVAYSYERALAIKVSDEMRRRSMVDPVNRQITQVKNTMIKNWNAAFFALLNSLIPAGQVYSLAGTPGTDAGVTDERWDSIRIQQGTTGTTGTIPGASFIRQHIADMIWLVENAAYDAQGQNFFGFEPDTLIINHTHKLALFKSQDFAKPYIGDAATSSIQYTGLMPNKILNLDVLVSRQCPTNSAYVCQRGRMGFYSDELPLMASPLYRDEPRKTWRSDVQRASAMGLDQPQAIVRIDNALVFPAGPTGGTVI